MRTIAAVTLIAAAVLVTANAWAADTEDDNPVLAIVGDVEIHQSDVDHLYYQADVTPDQFPPENALRELVRRQSIRQYVLNSDFEFDQAKIDETWEQWVDGLGQNGLTLAQFAEMKRMTEDEIKEIHVIDQRLRQLIDSMVTDDDLKQLEEIVRASHILINLEKDASDEEVQQATAKIEFIKQEIENGEAFEDAAKAYSGCDSKEQGGDLGYFPRYGAMVEPFAAAAYSQKVGVLGDPVRSDFGLHLIKVTDRRKTTDEEKAYAHELLLRFKFGLLMEKITDTVEVEYVGKDTPEKDGEPAATNNDSPAKEE